jgi:hypothetical protein
MIKIMVYVKSGDYSAGAVVTVEGESADEVIGALRELCGDDAVEPLTPEVLTIDAALSEDKAGDISEIDGVSAVSPEYGAKIPPIEPVENMDRYLST